MNLARQNPQRYASFLEQRKPFYAGKYFSRPDGILIETEEGVNAVEEAIHYLRSLNPMSPFRPSLGMSLGAKDHVKDQGPTGTIGHDGRDGSQSWDRISRYGTWQIAAGENIAYGSEDARDVVIGLIVDDGVYDRGHRKNIFNPEFRVVGVACGPHSSYRTICVITFAGGFIDERSW